MPGFKRIVFATDFSEASDRALGYALNIADHHGAELHLLHIKVTLQAHLIPDFAGVTEQIENAQDQSADELLRKLIPKSTRAKIVTASERHNKAAPAIAEYADKHKADLVVVGSHGYSGLDRLVMGSEAQRLVRMANVPVLVIRPEARASRSSASPFTSILAPVDLSGAARQTLQEADELASEYGAKLLVVHALDVIIPSHYGQLASPIDPVDAENALAGFMAETTLKNTPKTIVTAGPAGPGIVETAERHGADLIMMAKTGLSGWQRLLVGSVTDRVLNSAACPVLVLPPGE